MMSKVEKYDCYKQWMAERNTLLISGDNPNRLKELQDKIDYFEWGIINK